MVTDGTGGTSTATSTASSMVVGGTGGTSTATSTASAIVVGGTGGRSTATLGAVEFADRGAAVEVLVVAVVSGAGAGSSA